MFTGIVQEVGLVRKSDRQGQGLRLTLEAPKLSPRVKTGGSVAVNGCCLTVVEVKPPMFTFDAVPETLDRTVLGSLPEGCRVNLELPLTLAEPLGGHFVQGHVDGVGRVQEIKSEGQGARMRVEIPGPLAHYVIEKGSIALDGISLTVASVEENKVEVALVPHTLQNTNLRSKKAGDAIHVEADMLAKYVEKFIVVNVKTRKRLFNREGARRFSMTEITESGMAPNSIATSNGGGKFAKKSKGRGIAKKKK